MFLKYDTINYILGIFYRPYQLFFCLVSFGFSLSVFGNEVANDLQEKPFENKMSFDKAQALEPTEISQLELRTSASDPILANTIENEIKAEKIIRLGQISGIIIDSITGNPLHAVAVIIEGTDFGTITDIQGQYTLSDIPVGNYTLIFIKSGFIETKITGNQIVASGETQLDFAMPARPIEMSDEVYELQDFIVTAEEVASQNVELLMYRQLSIASLEALSSEDFAKFAASDAAEAISKISGASLNDGKYVVMRGLNDRYNTTLVNGVRLPSPDPDRKAVAMDIFPTSLFESIVARKTYTSNMPGESSGGSIELRTKSAPEEPFVKFSAGFGQQLTSTQTDQYLGDPEQLSYSNWLKGKDGDRGYSLVPGSKNFTSNYPTQVGGVGFPRMAPNVVAFPKWGDRSYSLSAGNSWLINDWLTVGAILGLKTGEKKRTSYKEFFKKEINDSKKTVKEIALKANGGGMTTSEEEYSLSTLAGLNFQIADHSSVNYTYLLAKTLSSKATVADYKKFGEVTLFEASTPDSEYHDARDIELLAQDRLLEAHQFSGEHKFKFLIPKEWDFSWYHTDAFMSQGEPDIRNVAEFYPTQDSFAADPGLEPLSRYQRFTEQESTMFGLSLEQEFKIGEKASIRFQLGYDSEDSARDFQQLEMLNQDARYVTDPYFGAMPFPDAFGITNISEPERFQTTVGGMNAIIEQLFTTNITNAQNDLGASQTNLNNALTSYTNAESDFLIKKTNFDTGFIGFVEPGTNYDNFTSSNTYNEAIVNQELARLEQGLDPTPGLGGFDMLNQDYAIAAYADGLLTPLQANLNTAQSAFDSADDNALNEGYEINIDLTDFNSIGPYISGSPSTLDLFNVNILNELNQYKLLDLYILDDSTIDYIELTITTDSDPPITNFSVTALAGENGSVEPSSPVVYYSPTEVTLTATPEDGYVFSNWSGDIADSLSTNNPVILSVSSNTTITANFVASGTTDSGSDRILQSLANMIEIAIETDISTSEVSPQTAFLYNESDEFIGLDISTGEYFPGGSWAWNPIAQRATFNGNLMMDVWDYRFEGFMNSYVYPYTATIYRDPDNPTVATGTAIGVFYDGKADLDNNGKIDVFQIRDGDPFPDVSFTLDITDLLNSAFTNSPETALSVWTNLTVGKVIEYKSYKSTNLDDWELLDTKLVPLDTNQDQVFIKSEVNILE